MVVPHIFFYDFVILAVAVALLLRAWRGGADSSRDAFARACGFPDRDFPTVEGLVGFAAALLVALLIMRRAGSMPARIGSVALWT